MASRVSVARTNGERRPVLKIILLGDSGVGKTSLLRQFVQGKFENRYKATIGADFFTHEQEVDGRKVTFQIWDTAGQERFQSLGSAFYRGADACMLVFDITSSESFQHVSSWLQEFTLQAGKREVILIGNKADLQESGRQVFARGVQQWCDQYSADKGAPIAYIETSAKNNTRVSEAFLKIAAEALKSKPSMQEEQVVTVPSVKATLKAPPQQTKPEEKQCGC